MGQKYEVTKTHDEKQNSTTTEILDAQTGYTLVLQSPSWLAFFWDGKEQNPWKKVNRPLRERVLFRVYDPLKRTHMVAITARELYEYGSEGGAWQDEVYSDFFPKMKIDPSAQYVEVGAGLGGLIPHILECQKSSSPKPVVIDPANYPLMKDMIYYALGLDESQGFRRRLKQLISRIGLYCNPNKVRLINSRLSDAIQNHPDLENIADVVVDNCGAQLYPTTELRPGEILPRHNSDLQAKKRHMQQEIIGLESRLVKPSGALYSIGDNEKGITVWRRYPIRLAPSADKKIKP